MLVGYVRCCKVWPVDILSPRGRCGVCGQHPEEIVTIKERLEYLASVAEQADAPFSNDGPVKGVGSTPTGGTT